MHPEIFSLDLETSGTNPKQHAVLSIGIVHPATGEEFYREVRWNSVNVEPEAMRVNKLDVAKLDQPPREPLGVVDNQARQWVDAILLRHFELGKIPRAVAMGWNVGSFDLAFINAAMPALASRFSYRVIDLTSLCYAQDELRGKPLGTTKDSLRSTDPNLHNALFDARLGVQQWRALARTWGQ